MSRGSLPGIGQVDQPTRTGLLALDAKADALATADVALAAADAALDVRLDSLEAARRGWQNKMVNGELGVWQRGPGPFTTNGYCADQFTSLRIGSTCTVTREAFALGNTIAGHEPRYYMRAVVASVAGAGNTAIIQQPIEGVRTCAGQTVTISFWAKADAAKNIAVSVDQSFGTGGAPSAAVLSAGTTVALTTSWGRKTVTLTVPSISGKTLGTDASDNNFLAVDFWLDAGSSFNARTNSLGQQSGTFDFWGFQLEEGPVATPLELRPVGMELALCQRYLAVYGGDNVYEQLGGVGWAYSTIAAEIMTPWPVTMRAVPTLSYTGSWQISDAAAATPVTGVALAAASQTSRKQGAVRVNVAAGLTQFRPYRLETANNLTARVYVSAEL